MSQKCRILCLHGGQQNSDIFKNKLGGLRKLLKSAADFIFINAPHIYASSETNERCWWYKETDVNVSQTNSDVDIYVGFEESLATVQSFMNKNGPFNALLGFSQGAAFAAIIASMMQTGEYSENFDFVILISAFKLKNDCFNKLCEKQIEIPSLHIIGETDSIITKERSEELYNVFSEDNSTLILHAGGHYVPATSHLKKKYLDFINKYNKSDAKINVEMDL